MPRGDNGGRHPKFNSEICAAIVADIADELPYEYAAEANGIAEKTLYNWINQAKQDQAEGIESDYVKFLQDIKKAEAKRIKNHKQNINDHVDKWQCDAWMLERRWWKHYGPNAATIELNKKLEMLMEKANGKADGESKE